MGKQLCPMQVPDEPKQLTLTFGVEVEFILRIDPARDTLERGGSRGLPMSVEEAARNLVRVALDKNGYPVYGTFERCMKDSYYEKWYLGSDSSIMVEEFSLAPDWRRCYAMELTSPALPYNVASLTQVREVVQVLFTNFDILINESCGLHVHVGNERKGFPLQTLKNFCILTMTFERELESLHPPSRIGNGFCQSSGQNFEGISPWDIERIIKTMSSKENLIWRMQGNKGFFAYNLLNLNFAKKTIEFRQHKATLDVDAIIKWVEMSCGLVEKAHGFATEDCVGVDDDPFGKLDGYVEDTYHAPHRSIRDVLINLGMHELANFYSKRGLFTHARPAWVWADPVQEDAMEPWIDSEYIDDKQIIKTVAKSKVNQDKYWDMVLTCAAGRSIWVPCVGGDEFRAHECCFCNSRACRWRSSSLRFTEDVGATRDA